MVRERMLIIAVLHSRLLGMLLFLYIACVMIFLSSNSRWLRCNTRPRGLQQLSVLVCVCSPPLLSPSAIALTSFHGFSPRAHPPVFHYHCHSVSPHAPLTSLCPCHPSISTLPHVSCRCLAFSYPFKRESNLFGI